MDTNEKIDLSDKRVVSFISNESVRIENVESFITEPELYSVITYNSLSNDFDEKFPFLKLCNEISKTLDKINFTPFQKKVHRMKYRISIFIVLLAVGISVLDTTQEGFEFLVKYFNFNFSVIFIQIIIFVLLIAILFSLIFTDKIETIPFFDKINQFEKDPNYYFRKFEKFKKSNNKSYKDFTDLAQKWFKPKQTYLLALYYINWELDDDKENSIALLILNLIQKCDNIKVVYVNDKYDLQTNENDVLNREFNRGKFRVFFKEFKNIDEGVIIEKAKQFGNKKFFELIYKHLSLNLTEFEIELLYKNIDNSYNEFLVTDNLNTHNIYKSSISETLIQNKKTKIIISKFLNQPVEWTKLDSIKKQLLLITFLTKYFFNKPLEYSLAIKFFLIKENPKVSKKEMYFELINDNFIKLKESADKLERNITENLNGVVNSISFECEKKCFTYEKPDWIIEYIFANLENFNKENLIIISDEEFIEVVKFFIFFYPLDSSLNKKILTRLFNYLDKNNKFKFRLFIANKLCDIPYESDKNAALLMYCNTLAENIWTEFESIASSYTKIDNFNELKLKIFDFSINFQELEFKPYKTLYQLFSNIVNRVNYIHTSIDDMYAIYENISKYRFSHAYNKDFDKFAYKYDELNQRFLYYTGVRDLNFNKYPSIDLMYKIENETVILVPFLKDKHIQEIPVLNLTNFGLNDIDDLEYLFLFSLVIIHNNSYFSSDKKKIVIKGTFNENDFQTLLEILRKYKNKLDELKRKSLNFKKYSYYNLYKIKLDLIIKYLKKLDLKFDFQTISDSFTEFNIKNFSPIIQQFKILEDWYGIVDSLFWESWFETRLGLTISFNIENNIKQIIEYSKDKLNYFHFDNSLIYLGVITNTAIPPAKGYELINKLLNRQLHIPNFILTEFLKSLRIICYNGEFKDKSLLYSDCLMISNSLLTNFSDYLDKSEITHINLANVSLLQLNRKQNENEILSILEKVKSDIDSLKDEDKGFFYFHYLPYLVQKNKQDEIIGNNYIQLAKKYLVKNKFYYIQFLQNYVERYYFIITDPKISRLSELLNSKIKKYNEIVVEYNEKIKDDYNLKSLFKQESDEKNVLAKEIDEIEKQISTLNSNKDCVKELETELNDFIKEYEFSKIYSKDDHPTKYVIAHTALVLAHQNHNLFSLSNDKTITFYNIALQHFFDLQEFIPFLEIILELKIFHNNHSSIKDFSVLEEQVKNLIQISKSRYLLVFSDSLENETEHLANLIYDYFNPTLTNSREDYSYFLSLDKKLDKVKTGWKHDNDTIGFRKVLSAFYIEYQNQTNISRLLLLFKEVTNYAKKHGEELTFNDIKIIDTAYSKLQSQIDTVDNTELHLDLANDIEHIKQLYKELRNVKLTNIL